MFWFSLEETNIYLRILDSLFLCWNLEDWNLNYRHFIQLFIPCNFTFLWSLDYKALNSRLTIYIMQESQIMNSIKNLDKLRVLDIFFVQSYPLLN